MDNKGSKLWLKIKIINKNVINSKVIIMKKTKIKNKIMT